MPVPVMTFDLVMTPGWFRQTVSGESVSTKTPKNLCKVDLLWLAAEIVMCTAAERDMVLSYGPVSMHTGVHCP